jgi:hypothetical protein
MPNYRTIVASKFLRIEFPTAIVKGEHLVMEFEPDGTLKLRRCSAHKSFRISVKEVFFRALDRTIVSKSAFRKTLVALNDPASPESTRLLKKISPRPRVRG